MEFVNQTERGGVNEITEAQKASQTHKRTIGLDPFTLD